MPRAAACAARAGNKARQGCHGLSTVAPAPPLSFRCSGAWRRVGPWGATPDTRPTRSPPQHKAVPFDATAECAQVQQRLRSRRDWRATAGRSFNRSSPSLPSPPSLPLHAVFCASATLAGSITGKDASRPGGAEGEGVRNSHTPDVHRSLRAAFFEPQNSRARQLLPATLFYLARRRSRRRRRRRQAAGPTGERQPRRPTTLSSRRGDPGHRRANPLSPPPSPQGVSVAAAPGRTSQFRRRCRPTRPNRREKRAGQTGSAPFAAGSRVLSASPRRLPWGNGLDPAGDGRPLEVGDDDRCGTRGVESHDPLVTGTCPRHRVHRKAVVPLSPRSFVTPKGVGRSMGGSGLCGWCRRMPQLPVAHAHPLCPEPRLPPAATSLCRVSPPPSPHPASAHREIRTA